jgi:hypothetical protein
MTSQQVRTSTQASRQIFDMRRHSVRAAWVSCHKYVEMHIGPAPCTACQRALARSVEFEARDDGLRHAQATPCMTGSLEPSAAARFTRSIVVH